jgi:hypothetical protein
MLLAIEPAAKDRQKQHLQIIASRHFGESYILVLDAHKFGSTLERDLDVIMDSLVKGRPSRAEHTFPR